MAFKLLLNSKISSIIVLIPDISFLFTINTSSISVTVTCSLIKVPMLQRVNINIIAYSYLNFFITDE